MQFFYVLIPDLKLAQKTYMKSFISRHGIFSPKIIIEKHHCGLQKQNLVEKDIKHDPFLLLLATISQNFDKKLP